MAPPGRFCQRGFSGAGISCGKPSQWGRTFPCAQCPSPTLYQPCKIIMKNYSWFRRAPSPRTHRRTRVQTHSHCTLTRTQGSATANPMRTPEAKLKNHHGKVWGSALFPPRPAPPAPARVDGSAVLQGAERSSGAARPGRELGPGQSLPGARLGPPPWGTKLLHREMRSSENFHPGLSFSFSFFLPFLSLFFFFPRSQSETAPALTSALCILAK